MCTPPRTQCGASCVDTSTDTANCGSCGNACPAGTPCTGGTCSCPTSLTVCGTFCVDLGTSNLNCGACGNACPATQSCVGGTCQCAAGRNHCAGRCVNEATDPNNCGACGVVCPATLSCIGGACTCAPPTSLCSGRCVNTNNTHDELRRMRDRVSGDAELHRRHVCMPGAERALRRSLHEHELRPEQLRYVRFALSVGPVLRIRRLPRTLSRVSLRRVPRAHAPLPSLIPLPMRTRPSPLSRPPRPRRRRSIVRFLPLALGVALFVLARWFALAQTPRRASSFETLEWDLGTTPAGPMRAVVLLPRHRSASDRFPLLIAFHGRGEALRGPERGAWGWARDYELGASDLALRRTHLSRDAFLDLVDEPRLEAIRRDLRRQSYRGLVVVTPYTPDVLTADGGPSLQQAFDDVVVNTIVPRARRELPVLATREATGIDGVSLGGLHSLSIGLGHPEVFGAVGSLQAAVRNRQEQVADRYVAFADASVSANPTDHIGRRPAAPGQPTAVRHVSRARDRPRDPRCPGPTRLPVQSRSRRDRDASVPRPRAAWRDAAVAISRCWCGANGGDRDCVAARSPPRARRTRRCSP